MTDRSFHRPRWSPQDSETGSWRLIGGHRLDPRLKVEPMRGSSPAAQAEAMPGTQRPNPAICKATQEWGSHATDADRQPQSHTRGHANPARQVLLTKHDLHA